MNHPINSHTPGPFRHEGTELLDVGDVPSVPHAVIRSEGERWAALVEVTDGECEANARLVPAALNAFDKAGRTLGVDAAELAERVDLAALIHAARHALAYLDTQPNATPGSIAEVGQCGARYLLRTELAKLSV